MTDEKERLRLVPPFQSFDVEPPEVPLGGRKVGRVGIEILGGERGDFRGSVVLVAQIPFGHGGFRWVDRLNDEFGERAGGSWERGSGEESPELRDHGGFGEIPRPAT